MKRTNRNRIFIIAILVTSTVFPVWSQVLDMPVAIVRLNETVSIGQRQLRRDVDLIERQAGRSLTVDERGELLEERINGVLLNQGASRAGIRASDEEIQQAIAAQRQSLGQPVSDQQFRQIVEQQMGLSWETFIEEITNRVIQEKYVLEQARGRFESVEEPSEEDIRFVYETNAQQFFNPLMVRFEHLFFDVRNKSNSEIQQLRTQATRMARELARGTSTFPGMMRQSMDDISYAGGDFGYLIAGDQEAAQRLGASFVNSVFRLDDDEVSGVLESNVGFHIVRITDRRSPRLPGLGDPVLPGENITVRRQVRAFVENQRQQEIFEETVNSVVTDLRQQAEITRYRERLDW